MNMAMKHLKLDKNFVAVELDDDGATSLTSNQLVLPYSTTFVKATHAANGQMAFDGTTLVSLDADTEIKTICLEPNMGFLSCPNVRGFDHGFVSQRSFASSV